MSFVRIRIGELALRFVLKLPDDVRLAGAGVERYFTHSPADALVLIAEMPGVPEGASEAVPVYTDNGQPGTIEFTGWQWYRADGSEIKPAAAGTGT